MEESERARFVVGVDGSEASVEALRQAQRLASPAGAKVLAILNEALEQAFGDESPPNVIPRVVRGHPRDSLIDASRHADMIVIGRRGHGGFGGLLLGSVSSACVAHAHCPVSVVHTSDKKRKEDKP